MGSLGGCGSGGHSVSEQLASFATDFESKILRPVREKRAAGDEVLAIQPVALGVSTAVQQCTPLIDQGV